jgi:hypothetical protein
MAVRRYTTTLDVPTGKIRTDSGGDPVQQENWSPDDAAKLRAEQLSRLQTSVVESTTAARANRHNQAITFERVPCGSSGTKVVLAHRLNRPARWAVVDWQRGTPGGTHGLEKSAIASDVNDNNTLTLVSYVAGTASIEVW